MKCQLCNENVNNLSGNIVGGLHICSPPQEYRKEIKNLWTKISDLKDKLHRRNMQIKDLKAENKELKDHIQFDLRGTVE